MCGILGYISNSKKITEETFALSMQTMKHRGPDANGIFVNQNASLHLGHLRLSILDLSVSSNQPFYSQCGRYIIIYNGELYNFKEIKEDCKIQTKTTGDTEIIIESFAQHNNSCFSWLNGMFAFAIYDIQENKITLCRDRFGIKPLYYYYDGDRFAFSSELKALKKIEGFDLALNKMVFSEFLHLGYIPFPNTAYKNIYKFPVGAYLEIDLNKEKIDVPEFKYYWKLNEQISRHTYTDETEVKTELKRLLEDSVSKQLISDVPIGTFLSGGIDSSLITAIAAKLKNNKIKTFSIGYEKNQYNKFNEAHFAETVAKQIGTEHYSLTLKEEDILPILSNIISTYDEPYADSSAYPTMLVSKLAREQVTVTLSGDGADELFMGYGMYNWSQRLNNPIIKTLSPVFYPLTKAGSNKIKRAGLLLKYPENNAHLKTHIFSQEQYFFSEKELEEILVEPVINLNSLNESIQTNRQLTNREKQSFWDISNYLVDDLLVKVDRASMLYSLESRVPFLDNNLVDYALNIDDSLKHKHGINKYILKEVLYTYLPKNLFERPKWGFAVPISKWLKTNLYFLIEKYLSKECIEKYNIIHFKAADDIVKRFIKGEEYLYVRIWVMLLLHWWLEENT
ncbi:MAG TPA: asparagine synthase (glutamine-hydrolyzing) [Chitinophagales bacterium]|nr:asparagine synthase (glutamine-hydrolyzing) [Chitinophagales bacterium]